MTPKRKSIELIVLLLSLIAIPFLVSRLHLLFLEYDFFFPILTGLLSFLSTWLLIRRLSSPAISEEDQKYENALDDFRNILITTHTVEMACEKIYRFIQSNFGIDSPKIYLWDEEKGKFVPYRESNQPDFVIYDPFLLWIADHDSIFTKGEFQENDSLEKIREHAIRFMESTSSNLIVPLILNNSLLGIVALGPKSSGKPFTSKDIERLNEVRSSSVMSLSNAIFYERLIDMTETLEAKVKERTKALEETQSQLIMSEKMASLGIMVAGIAHEINTPSGVINAAADNLDFNMNYLVHNIFNIAELSLHHKLKRSFELSLLRVIQDKKQAIPETKSRFKLKKEMEQSLREDGISSEMANEAASFLIENELVSQKELISYVLKEGGEKAFGMLKNSAYIYRNIKNIRYAIKNIVRIIKALKYYSHLDQSKSSEEDLTEGLENTLVILHNQIKHGISVKRQYKPIRKVHCNADELNQVWTNIIQNAVQAMKGKGDLEIGVQEENGKALVTIRDNGPGIPAEIKDRIWDPFFTTKDQGEGSGLGLGIVKGIIEKHHGTIEVDSKPGSTCFRILLPFEPPVEEK